MIGVSLLLPASGQGSGPSFAHRLAEQCWQPKFSISTIWRWKPFPAFIASIVGYSIFGAWIGWTPIFTIAGSLAFPSPPKLLYYVVIGLLCGLIGLLYARGFYGLTHCFHRLPLPRWLKPAIGGLLVGLIGLALPQALGMGYGWVQVSMGPGLLSLPLWVILLLPFAKILTTGLSIGSGGSGGI